MGRLGGAFIAIVYLINLSAVVSATNVVSIVTATLTATAKDLCPLFTPIVNYLNAFVAKDSASSGVLFKGLRTDMTKRVGIDPS